MRRAADAYVAEDFESAIILYEQVLDTYSPNADIHFNLGNAYYESGQLGLALVNYFRAQAISPRMDGLDRSIVRVRAERIDFQRDEQNLPRRLASSTQGVVTRTELGWVAAAFWIGWFLLATAWIILTRHRRRLLPICVATGILMILVVGLYAARSYTEATTPLAIVTANSAQVMSGPGDSYLPLYTLYSGAEVRILEQRDGWLRFILPSGRQGWLGIESLEEV